MTSVVSRILFMSYSFSSAPPLIAFISSLLADMSAQALARGFSLFAIFFFFFFFSSPPPLFRVLLSPHGRYVGRGVGPRFSAIGLYCFEFGREGVLFFLEHGGPRGKLPDVHGERFFFLRGRYESAAREGRCDE